jgi:hypothetical protein
MVEGEARLMTTPNGPDRDHQLGVYEHQPVAERDSGSLVNDREPGSEDGCFSRAPRDFPGMPRSYVTEVSVPSFGDDGVQRLYAPMKQPEYEHAAEGRQLPTRADLDQATAMTAAAIADPASTPADICHAANLEAAVLSAYWHAPGAQAELEAEP